MRDRLWIYLGVDPKFTSLGRSVNFGSANNNAGVQSFSRDQQTYFTTARVDATVTNKLRVFGSWLYQLQRTTGAVLPVGDSTSGLLNPTSTNPLSLYQHGYGYVAPNQTLNVGADMALDAEVGAHYAFRLFLRELSRLRLSDNGVVVLVADFGNYADPGNPPVPQVDNRHNGNPLPQSLQQIAGYLFHRQRSDLHRPQCEQASPVRPGCRVVQGRSAGHPQLQIRVPAQPCVQ